MSETLLWLLLVAAIAVAWIEWIPDRYKIFVWIFVALRIVTIGLRWIPQWYGWVILLIGIAPLAWIYFSPKRRKEWPNLFSAPAEVLQKCFTAIESAARSGAGRMRDKMRDRKRVEQTAPSREKANFLTLARLRNAVVGVSAVILSPLAALPSAIVVSALLVSWEAFFGNAPQPAGDLPEFAKQVFEVSFYCVFVAYVLIASNLLISGPLLLIGGYAIAARAIGSGVFWRRYWRGLLLFGTIYPALYVAGDVFHWFDMPYID
jgi:hypothetical protein